MKKNAILLVVCLLGLATAASAANNYTSAGCGFGAMIFKGKSGKVQLILAATTNGSFGSQTFGISSETLDCSADGVVKNDSRADVYAAVNFQNIQRDIAMGGGEFVDGLASLMGYQTAQQQRAFAKLAQANYERVFPKPGTDSTQMLAALRTL